eukprot:TRINITY_DN28584_c0_g1_i1.p1 TRINITY_DN28584_c0_g1~~TRINITY_DN28584_c0_g1_i1.p1  ORF type:complete len:394 (+),score=23.44 TRINITY_DN28584_c0_g1_i1:500-1681(+)
MAALASIARANAQNANSEGAQGLATNLGQVAQLREILQLKVLKENKEVTKMLSTHDRSELIALRDKLLRKVPNKMAPYSRSHEKGYGNVLPAYEDVLKRLIHRLRVVCRALDESMLPRRRSTFRTAGQVSDPDEREQWLSHLKLFLSQYQIDDDVVLTSPDRSARVGASQSQPQRGTRADGSRGGGTTPLSLQSLQHHAARHRRNATEPVMMTRARYTTQPQPHPPPPQQPQRESHTYNSNGHGGHVARYDSGSMGYPSDRTSSDMRDMKIDAIEPPRRNGTLHHTSGAIQHTRHLSVPESDWGSRAPQRSPRRPTPRRQDQVVGAGTTRGGPADTSSSTSVHLADSRGAANGERTKQPRKLGPSDLRPLSSGGLSNPVTPVRDSSRSRYPDP